MIADSSYRPFMHCSIKCGLGCDEEVQQYQAEDNAANGSDKQKRHHVSLERIGLWRPHPGKHGLLQIQKPLQTCAPAWSKVKDGNIQKTENEIPNRDQPPNRFHF